MRIVSCGCRLFDIVQGVQMGMYVILKTAVFVTMNSSWNAIDIEPFVNQDLSDSKCLLVVSHESLTKCGKSISQHLYILFTIFGWVNLEEVNTQRSRVLLATSDPCCSKPSQLDTADNWLHILLCPSTMCFNKQSGCYLSTDGSDESIKIRIFDEEEKEQ